MTHPRRGYVDCQDCPEIHQADYSHQNEYGQTLYAVVCGPYVEYYDVTVVMTRTETGESK